MSFRNRPAERFPFTVSRLVKRSALLPLLLWRYAMKVRMLGLMVVGLLVAADGATESAAKKERQQLEGSWTVVSMTRNGEKMEADEAKKFTLIVDGDKYTLKNED